MYKKDLLNKKGLLLTGLIKKIAEGGMYSRVINVYSVLVVSLLSNYFGRNCLVAQSEHNFSPEKVDSSFRPKFVVVGIQTTRDITVLARVAMGSFL